MKKRLKGLLVLWLAFLMVVSTPMTANAANDYVGNVALYKGKEALQAGYEYGYGNILFEVQNNGLSVSDTYTVGASLKNILTIEEHPGYSMIGWRLWNSTSGYMLSEPSVIKDTSYTITDTDHQKYVQPTKYVEYMVVEPVWKLDYEITHQPQPTEPYVGLNADGEKVEGKSYQWYKEEKNIQDYVVSNYAYTTYDEASNTWTAPEGVMSFNVSKLTKGDILLITPQSSAININDYDENFSFSKNESEVWYCEKTGDLPEKPDSNGLSIRFVGDEINPDAQYKVTLQVFKQATEQTSAAYSGANGDCLCKVNFANGASIYSDPFTYTSYSITAKPTTNGSYSLQVGGQEVTKAIPRSEVAVVATADEGYELESISVTPDGGDGNSIEFKDPTTFIMPDGPISVDVAFKKKTYGITLPTSPVGYSVNPVLVEGEQKTSVEHGNSFTFDVSIAEGYAATNNYAVKANGTTLTATSSKDNVYTYTIENITAEQEITVTGVEKTYPVTMSEAANGSVSVAAEDGSSTSGAVKGTIFTITPTPAEGYELDTLTVIQKDGSDTAVTVDDKNQFTMPEYPVEVSVTFKKKTYGITLPEGQTGYTVTSSQTSPVEHGSDYTFKVTISDGYDVPSALSVKANGNALVATTVSGKEYTYTLEKVASAQEITVDGVSDITGPEVTITLDAENTWKHFLFKIGFGLFFQEEKKLTIDAVDTGSGRGSVTYYVSETDLFPAEETYSAEEIEKRIPQWTEYSGAVFITVDRSYVVYAKATDIAGNVTYVSTSGMVIDTTKPVISGLEDGGQYYGDTATTISDANLSAVKLDGKAVEFTGTSASVTITADGAEHTIEATDKAGNQTAYKVTVSETWVRDGISSAGSRALKLGVPYKFGTGKWKVAGDTTVYEGGNTFYASEGGTFEFQTQ